MKVRVKVGVSGKLAYLWREAADGPANHLICVGLCQQLGEERIQLMTSALVLKRTLTSRWSPVLSSEGEARENALG
jgi:hypothetical protein